MEVVNPFILKNKERMIVFLDQLSSVTDPNPPPGCMQEQSNSSTLSSSDAGRAERALLVYAFHLTIASVCHTGRELATLHHICVSYLPELQAMSKTNNALKKLVTVTEMLSKHKLKYREMIS